MSATIPHAGHITMARTLRAGGWTYPEIVRLLEQDGVRVHWGTVRRWCDPQEAERHRDYQREYMRQRRSRGPDPRKDPLEMARRLRCEGQPLAGIGRTLRVLFGGRWSRSDVERLLGEGS